MFEFVMKFMDCVAIPLGILALVSSLIFPEWGAEYNLVGIIGFVAGIVGILYIIYGIYLFSVRAKFDWHLHNGHFLRKVAIIVLLMPFVLALAIHAIDANVESNELFADSKNVSEQVAGNEGIACEYKQERNNSPFLWSVYYHFIDPGNQHSATTARGRNWAMLIAILGVFLLNGLLVTSMVGWIDRRKERWIKGEVRYGWFLRCRKRYVIIGGNDIVAGLVKQLFLKKGGCLGRLVRPYILIQTSRDVESFRRELFSNLSKEEQQHVIIYYGDRTSERDIETLRVDKAKEVYILGEEARTDDMESYHDTMNMQCLRLIGKYMKSHKSWLGKKLLCRVMFEYQTSFSAFQFNDLDNNIGATIDFRPFNYYEMWAQKVLVNRELTPDGLQGSFNEGGYLPLEGTRGIKKDDDDYVHLFVVGMSRMGVAMAIEAAHMAHYPNFESEKTRKKIRSKITFIDIDASTEKEFFMGRFKELFALSHWRYGEVKGDKVVFDSPHVITGSRHLGGDFIDVEWEFINGGIAQSAVQDYILASAKPSARVTIAICLPESNRSHAAALFLDKRIYESASVQQVLVYNRYGDAIIDSLRSEVVNKEARYPYLNKVKLFFKRALGYNDSSIDSLSSKAVNKEARYPCLNKVILFFKRALGYKDSSIDSLSSEAVNKEARYPYLNKLRAFGMSGECFDVESLEQSEAIGEAIDRRYDEIRKKSMEEGGGSGKSAAAKMWSNIYNGNTMWTKLRSINGTNLWSADKTKHTKDDKDNINMLANVEHNRWNVEQLLMNFRPLTKKEQDAVRKGKVSKNRMKAKMAHLDICSNKRLRKVDADAVNYDKDPTIKLPDIYKKLK